MGLTGGQKACLWIVIFGSLALLAGSAGPYWLTTDVILLKSNQGLWFICMEVVSETTCEVYQWADADFGDFTVWFYVVHAAAGLATLISIIVVFISLVKVCGESNSAGSAGGLALCAGLLGIGAAVVFSLKSVESLNTPSTSLEEKGWAFYVFSSGSGLVTLFGIIVLALPNSNAVTPGHY